MVGDIEAVLLYAGLLVGDEIRTGGDHRDAPRTQSRSCGCTPLGRSGSPRCCFGRTGARQTRRGAAARGHCHSTAVLQCVWPGDWMSVVFGAWMSAIRRLGVTSRVGTAGPDGRRPRGARLAWRRSVHIACGRTPLVQAHISLRTSGAGDEAEDRASASSDPGFPRSAPLVQTQGSGSGSGPGSVPASSGTPMRRHN